MSANGNTAIDLSLTASLCTAAVAGTCVVGTVCFDARNFSARRPPIPRINTALTIQGRNGRIAPGARAGAATGEMRIDGAGLDVERRLDGGCATISGAISRRTSSTKAS